MLRTPIVDSEAAQRNRRPRANEHARATTPLGETARRVNILWKSHGPVGQTSREVGIWRTGPGRRRVRMLESHRGFGCFESLTGRAGRGRPGPTRERWPNPQLLGFEITNFLQLENITKSHIKRHVSAVENDISRIVTSCHTQMSLSVSSYSFVRNNSKGYTPPYVKT